VFLVVLAVVGSTIFFFFTGLGLVYLGRGASSIITVSAAISFLLVWVTHITSVAIMWVRDNV